MHNCREWVTKLDIRNSIPGRDMKISLRLPTRAALRSNQDGEVNQREDDHRQIVKPIEIYFHILYTSSSQDIFWYQFIVSVNGMTQVVSDVTRWLSDGFVRLFNDDIYNALVI
jgi:hypothetical protein